MLDEDSETLEYRGGTIFAVVNRGLDAKALDAGQIDFSDRNKSHVELLQSAVSSAPRVGEHFIDGDGEFHRIQVLRRTDISYKCDCEVAGPDS